MSNTIEKPVAESLDTLFRIGVASGLSDRTLLERFLERGPAAEAAFETLLERHGPMVHRVCRSILQDDHEVADAFQATFLVLVRRAGAIRRRNSMASWLYGVARRVALRQKANSRTRRARETRAAIDPTASVAVTDPAREPSYASLHAEIDRLPEKYRSPVILCHLQGQTIDQASRQLGWPPGTVAGRLARARERLRTRLVRQGFAVGTLLKLTEPMTPQAQASVLSSLIQTTAPKAQSALGGKLVAGPSCSFSREVVLLTEGVLHAMILTKLKATALTFAVASSLLVGAGVFARQLPSTKPEAPQDDQPGQVATTVPKKPAQQQVNPPVESGIAKFVRPPDPRQTTEGQNDRFRKSLLSQHYTNIAKLGPEVAANDGSPRTKDLLDQLNQPIAMSFAAETPLDEVLNYVKAATKEASGKNIPIYVDPVGLQEAEKTMSSGITIDLTDVPLRTTLRLLLKQIGLAYCVKDGLIIISSPQGIMQELLECATDEQMQMLNYGGIMGGMDRGFSGARGGFQ